MAILERPTDFIQNPEWQRLRDTYQCRVWLIPDADGDGYTAIAVRLPGVVSEGDTIEEALTNIKDAFRQAILTYRDHGVDIPWNNVDPESDNAFQRWILVDV